MLSVGRWMDGEMVMLMGRFEVEVEVEGMGLRG